MKILISTYIALIMFTFIGFTSVDYIMMNKQINMARGFYSTCVENMENSNFCQDVIEQCNEQAQNYGYILNLVDCSEQAKTKKGPYYYVSLEYKTKSSIFKIDENSTIKGYAG